MEEENIRDRLIVILRITELPIYQNKVNSHIYTYLYKRRISKTFPKMFFFISATTYIQRNKDLQYKRSVMREI